MLCQGIERAKVGACQLASKLALAALRRMVLVQRCSIDTHLLVDEVVAHMVSCSPSLVTPLPQNSD